jgi:hypothetical protein
VPKSSMAIVTPRVRRLFNLSNVEIGLLTNEAERLGRQHWSIRPQSNAGT